MRHARQPAPVRRVPQAGQASNSASGARALMRASCRNAVAVVTATAADYHLRMTASNALQDFRFLRHPGPDNRLWLRSEGEAPVRHLAIAGFRGPAIPRAISSPVLERRGDTESGSWRLSCDQGSFDFEAQAVEQLETRPALFARLHRPFALSATDRIAVRCLLALLRLPGGAKLLRFWHARRSA